MGDDTAAPVGFIIRQPVKGLLAKLDDASRFTGMPGMIGP
jgi:hypothetical protein